MTYSKFRYILHKKEPKKKNQKSHIISMKELIRRICEKGKELALEKRKNSNLCSDNEKLKLQIKKLNNETEILNKELKRFKENVKRMEMLNVKAKNEILFLKLELYKQTTDSQFNKYETQLSGNSANSGAVDIVNSQDSDRSEESEANTDDNAMIDSEHDDSHDDIDRQSIYIIM